MWLVLILGLFVFGALTTVVLYSGWLTGSNARNTNKEEATQPSSSTSAKKFKNDSDRYTIIYQDGKTGFIDRTGKVVIVPQFEQTLGFAEGLAAAAVAQSSSGN